MTFLQSRLLIVQLVALLVATGGIITWYNKYFATFYDQHPLLAPVIVVAIPLYILCFSVGPQMWQGRLRAHRESIALAPDPVSGRPRHFRLDPYVTASPQEFRREDDAHNDVLKWINESSQPVLFLSGVSGAGKSSVLEAYVLPLLREEGWRVGQVRTFSDPLPRLETILAASRRQGTRLLVVFDQFEEFVILEDRASAEARRLFIARLQEICRTRPPGLRLLLSFRRDYMGDVIAMQIDDLIPGRTFMEIDAFKRGAARRFLEASPAAPSPGLVDRILSGAEALDDVPARFRPVTLNMIGLALEEYDREVAGRPERLVQSYVEAAMSQPDIKEIAPRVVEKMITEANTKRPRTVAELAADTRLSQSDVVACLVLFERKGLVRRLDAMWEISHDFVARQFALVLGRLRPNPWRNVRMFGAAAAFMLMLAVLVLAPIEMQYRGREQAYEALRRLNVSVTERRFTVGVMERVSGLHAIFPNQSVDNRRIVSAMPHLILLEISGLDISTTIKNADGVTQLPSFEKLPKLYFLYLSNLSVTELPPFDNLAKLRSLNLKYLKNVKTVPSLNKLSALQALSINLSEVTSLPSLDNLTALEDLDLSSNSKLTALPSLDKLTALRTLNLSNNSMLTELPSLDKLTALRTLDLSGNSMLTALPPLDSLTNLQQLNLFGSALLVDESTLQQLRTRGVSVIH
jgi:hypothetical protein